MSNWNINFSMNFHMNCIFNFYQSLFYIFWSNVLLWYASYAFPIFIYFFFYDRYWCQSIHHWQIRKMDATKFQYHFQNTSIENRKRTQNSDFMNLHNNFFLLLKYDTASTWRQKKKEKNLVQKKKMIWKKNCSIDFIFSAWFMHHVFGSAQPKTQSFFHYFIDITLFIVTNFQFLKQCMPMSRILANHLTISISCYFRHAAYSNFHSKIEK